jgi:hypothetical protein
MKPKSECILCGRRSGKGFIGVFTPSNPSLVGGRRAVPYFLCGRHVADQITVGLVEQAIIRRFRDAAQRNAVIELPKKP